MTPLCVAASNGHVFCVNMLIEAGANVNAFVNTDHTALSFVRLITLRS